MLGEVGFSPLVKNGGGEVGLSPQTLVQPFNIKFSEFIRIIDVYNYIGGRKGQNMWGWAGHAPRSQIVASKFCIHTIIKYVVSSPFSTKHLLTPLIELAIGSPPCIQALMLNGGIIILLFTITSK